MHAFSGNLFYGFGSQEEVLDEVDVNSQWEKTLATNIVISAVDTLSVYIAVKELIGRDFGKYVHAVVDNILRSVASYRASGGVVTIENVFDLMKRTAAAIMQQYLQLKSEQWAKDGVSRLAKQVSKFLARSIDVFYKVSKAAQAVERLQGLFSSNTLAIERAILVVGDPFAPVVASIDPLEGRPGDEVWIHGNNFITPEGTKPKVYFCDFSETSVDPETANVTSRVEVEVVEAMPNRLKIKIPNNIEPTTGGVTPNPFQSDRLAYICVEKQGNEPSNGHSRPLG